MPRRGKKPAYIVQNPRGIPKGIHVFRTASGDFLPGDRYDPAQDTPETLRWLLAAGLVREE